MFLSGAPSSLRQHEAKPRSCRRPELKNPEMSLFLSLLWNSRKSLAGKEQGWQSWFKEQLDTCSSLEMAQRVQCLCLELEHKQVKDRHLAVHPQQSTFSLPNWANSYRTAQDWLKLSFWCCIQHGHCKAPFLTAPSGAVLTPPQPSSQYSKNQVFGTKSQKRGQEDWRVLCPFLHQLFLPSTELSSSLARNFKSHFHDFMDRSI